MMDVVWSIGRGLVVGALVTFAEDKGISKRVVDLILILLVRYSMSLTSCVVEILERLFAIMYNELTFAAVGAFPETGNKRKKKPLTFSS